MSILNIILPPVVGGIIGAVTNDLAIKMLFRPYKPMYIGHFKVPFTPGIVPKNMEFLAEALGREVVNRFFNADDLIILFQSDAFSDTVAKAITDALLAKKTSLCLAMEKLEASEDTGTAIMNGKKQMCSYICSTLSEYNFTPVINSVCKDLCEGNHSESIPRTLKNSYASFSPFVSEAMNNFFREKGEKFLFPAINEVLVEFGDRPEKDLITSLVPDRDVLQEMIKRVYIRFMGSYVRDIVAGIDIGGMISEKFRLMEPEAIERLVVSIVKKELNYVVILGGVLGMIIGTVNIFF